MAINNLASEAYRQASLKTANDLRTIATSGDLYQLSRLSLPEVEHLTDEIARVVPAGNVPGIILSGLARLGGRQVSGTDSRKQVGLMFKGVRQVLDKAVYGTFFAGPAAVLYGYQQLLRLAGKDVDSAFPDGIWQFYLEFALREDSARHANETFGFQKQLSDYKVTLNEADFLAAWVLVSAFFLHQLPDVLTNGWREQVAIKTLLEVAPSLPDLYAEWDKVRPYARGADAGQDDYPAYRKRVFESFLKPRLNKLDDTARDTYQKRLDESEQKYLAPFLQQMSWLSYLEPDANNEIRTPYPLSDASIAVVWRGRYYLLPIASLLKPDQVREITAAIIGYHPSQPAAVLDDLLVTMRRSEQHGLRKTLDQQTQQDLYKLRRAPIIINWDERDVSQPLVLIRQAKRGIGDHALTIFRTAESTVFDQSHIFFDGMWGSAVAEIMTNEALSWAAYFSQLPAAKPAASLPYSPTLAASDAIAQTSRAASIPSETGAENITVRLNAVLALRKLLKQRSDLVKVTVNDLLLLYRGLHASVYAPSPQLEQAMEKLSHDPRKEAQEVYRAIREEHGRLKDKNPSILIPLDASRNNPRERIFPTTFRNPLTDFYEQHSECLNALRAYKAAARGGRGPEFQRFYDAQLAYLSLIGAFGEILTRYRTIALSGESTSTASIRFLGHLPMAVQKLLDTIPGKFDVLNEIIKGEEVFSNMGRVAANSSLRRFITAKDDNEQKTLAWGVLTDDKGILHLSLRDFRPHVAILQVLGLTELAQLITQDYLDAYANGFNQYIIELREIIIASRETMIDK